jgi:hypothetical protein
LSEKNKTRFKGGFFVFENFLIPLARELSLNHRNHSFEVELRDNGGLAAEQILGISGALSILRNQ